MQPSREWRSLAKASKIKPFWPATDFTVKDDEYQGTVGDVAESAAMNLLNKQHRDAANTVGEVADGGAGEVLAPGSALTA